MEILAVSCTMMLILPCVLCACALSAVMAGAWSLALRPGLSGWTDAIWSGAVGMAGAGLALAGGLATPRRGLASVLILLWALRLGWHIARRTIGGGDDPRYAELRREWGERFSARLFLFLQIQALAAWLLALCVMMAARNPVPFPAWSDGLGAALLLLAVAGEGLADRQLAAFRRNPDHHGLVCDTGLWGLSRHPNYFFEWLVWLGWAVMAIGPTGQWAPGWLALLGPVFMYWLLVHVSGIPPLEAHMLRSRGEAFRDVQARVNAFWPFPSRRSGDH
jgi:steroid 5-alpha reductase family enzyme